MPENEGFIACNPAEKAATTFPLTKVSYFGSYTDGRETEESDLDVLVEFTTDSTSYDESG
jgi:predicted nucleotidyltransferase